MADEAQILCPSCRMALPGTANFCSQCGRSLRAIAPPTTLSRQIALYLASFFLGPLAIGFAIKYFKQSDEKAKKIGIVMILIIAVSIGLTFWVANDFFQTLYAPLNSLNSLNSLGY